ncbi:MAG: hypothetical protein IJF03_09020 [Lachnospiraceae bacterium]|nr:hypothetical protein [Lachnospiraceae bacterium]
MRYQKKKIAAIVMLFVLAFTLVDVRMFTVQAANVIDITDSDLFEIIGVEDVTYSGREIVQNMTVKYDGNTMVENIDYYCLYTNNTNAGTATIRIVGKGNYTGAEEISFQIKKAIPDYSINSSITGTYGDTLGDIELPKRDNGVFTWNEDLTQETGEPGEHNFYLTFTPNDTRNYEIVENILVTVEIFQRNISEAEVEGIADAVYCAEPIIYEPVITWNDKTLVENKDYTITFDKNTNAGTALVTITGMEHYTGTIEKTFTIAKADPDYGEIGILSAVYRDCLGDITLPSRENGTFIWEYSQSMEVGKVGITSSLIRFVPNDKSNYNIIKNIPVEIKIDKKDIAKVTFSELKSKVYTGEEQTQNIYIKDGDVKLVRDKDYTVEYQDNIEVGTAKIIIKGVDNYTGEKVLEFAIEKAVPKYPKLEVCTAIYGQTLADVELMEEAVGKFYFEDDLNREVGEVGINSFYVTFKPADSKNYSEVEHIKVKVKVEPLDMSSAQVLGVTDGYATENEVKPEVSVKFQDELLVYGKDFSLGYANNVYPGQAAVVVKGIGNYTGKVVTFYQILE